MALHLVANAIRESPRKRNERAQNVLSHGDSVHAARIRDFDPARAQFRVHQLADAGCRRMDPFQLARNSKLGGPERGPDKDVRIRQFLFQAIKALEMEHSHGGPGRADVSRHFRRRVPK